MSSLAPISLPTHLVAAWHAQAAGCMAALREMREGEEEEEEGCSKDNREGSSSSTIARKRSCTAADRKNGSIKLTDAQKRRGKRIQSTLINHMKQN